jgi:hypothetical protein
MSNITMIQGMTLMEYSKFIANSSLVPKEYRGKPADIFITIDMGMELGLKPLQALQNIAVINGKPSIYADGLMAVARSHPSFENINEYYDEAKEMAVCTVKRKGQDAQTRTFSVTDAKKAGLWGRPGPWQTYPKRMLQMRARGFALRDVFADAIKGLITVEEAQDYPVEPLDITPQTTNIEKAATKTDLINSKLSNLLKNNVEIAKENAINTTEEEPTSNIDREGLATKLKNFIDEYEEVHALIASRLESLNLQSIEEMPDEILVKAVEYFEDKYEPKQ